MQLKIILNIFVLILLGFSIISLTVIVQGWFGHMTASGNEDKVSIAKNKMIIGAICLAIMITLLTVGNYFLKETDTAMADSNENFDKIYTTKIE
jgi:hypothetical protein